MSNDIRVNRSEINRLTKAIAEEENNINYAFQRIGQTYFAAHRQDAEESQKANIQAVLDAMQRASTYKDQINVLRGIAICPNCKAEVDINAAFCSCCGTRMPTQVPPAAPAAPAGAPICPNCGNVCAPGTRFCNQCGSKIPEAAPAAPTQNYAPVQGYAPVPEPAPAPAYSPIPEPVFQPQQDYAQAPVFNSVTDPEPAAPAPEADPDPAPVSDPEPVPAPEEPAPVLEQPAAPAQRFCANCGTPLDPDYRFCLECGTPVQ